MPCIRMYVPMNSFLIIHIHFHYLSLPLSLPHLTAPLAGSEDEDDFEGDDALLDTHRTELSDDIRSHSEGEINAVQSLSKTATQGDT